MAGDYGRAVDDYSIVNVMLPRNYFPAWQGNIFEQRAASIAAQLCGPEMVIDYDQLLAKRPFKDDAVFAWHQDMAYWLDTSDPRTATCWPAVDDSTIGNGCMRFVPGSHREPIRPHRPLHEDRSIPTLNSCGTSAGRLCTSSDEGALPVDIERSKGFTHSHNDALDVVESVGDAE